MATFEEVVEKIQIKFKISDLAVKENQRITWRNGLNELVKQQKAFEQLRNSCWKMIRVQKKLRIGLNYITKQFSKQGQITSQNYKKRVLWNKSKEECTEE